MNDDRELDLYLVYFRTQIKNKLAQMDEAGCDLSGLSDISKVQMAVKFSAEDISFYPPLIAKGIISNLKKLGL